MGVPIERWVKQATLLDPVPKRVKEGDILDLQRYQMSYWRKMGRELEESGDPIAMSESLYAGTIPGATPPAAQISTASISGTVAIWPTATYTPIPANSCVVPEVFRLIVAGQCTTSTSPANATFAPFLGTSVSGSSLGASGAYALTASITNSLWYLQGDMTIRSIGPTTTGTAIAMFLLHHRHAIAGAGDFITTTSSGTGQQIFGTTVATFDSTAASGLCMGITATVTTHTWKVDQIHWCSWN